MARGTMNVAKGRLRDVQRDMGIALVRYADGLIELSSEHSIQYKEWVTAFLGKSYFLPDDQPRLLRHTTTAMRVRHALGEPVLSFNGVHLGSLPRLITRPDDYDPINPETFFTFSLKREGQTYYGNMSCNVVGPVDGSRIAQTEGPYRHSTLDIVKVSRLASGLMLDVSSSLYQGEGSGLIYGLPAIREAGSEYLDANHVVLAGIESAVSRMRDFAGESARLP